MVSIPRRVTLLGLFLALVPVGLTLAQDGRVFRKTPETVAIWEMNDLPVGLDEPLANGDVIPDVSGNGLDAVVTGSSGQIVASQGFIDIFEENTACRRASGGGSARLEVANHEPFQFAEDESFSIELFVRRDETPGTQNWGILAGTWHSRTLLDDTGDPINEGAWYGWGFIRHNEGGGWRFTASPINPDGTFTPSFNEQATAAFEIEAGSHYVIASVNRETNVVEVYLDGQLASTGSLTPGRALITPTGYEPARMAFLTGVDDASRGAYRQSPTGYAIDAARVMRRTIDAEEAFDNWLLIQDGELIPFDPDATCSAVVTASSRDVLPDECIQLSGANSTAVDGADITKYEWKIGDGDFEEGAVTREVSFTTPTGPDGVEVSLRITDSRDCTSTASAIIVVRPATPVAVITPRLSGGVLVGSSVLLRTGDVLSLDGTASSTPIPATARVCPRGAGIPLDAIPIAEYRWDLDGDGNADDTRPSFDLDPAVEGSFTVTLTVANEAGEEASASIDVEVIAPPNVQPAPEGRVFLSTPETIAIWEMNDLGLLLDEPLPNDLVIEDVSGNGLDAVVEANDALELAIGEGDPRYDPSTTVNKLAAGTARVVVNDEDAFQFSETEDFTVELYVRRAEQVGTANWGILAGTWHSRTLLDDGGDLIADGAWYGYGFIRDNEGGGWLFNSSPINPDGTFTPGFNEIKTPAFEIPPGSHYVVATVDRTAQRASVFLDGEPKGGVALPDGQAFITPTDYDPARFMFFAGEDDLSRNAYRPAPSGYAIDAARVQARALTPEEVLENARLIRIGIAVPPEERMDTRTLFRRGDTTQDGVLNITDAVKIFGILFLGEPDITCDEAKDTNNDGDINITDGIRILGFLFLGQEPPPAPGHENCGPDPDEPGSRGDIGCESHPPCAPAG